MITLDEMKLAVCEKLPELIYYSDSFSGIDAWCWKMKGGTRCPIHWPTEGLQVCHEAEWQIIEQGLWSEYMVTIDNLFVPLSKSRGYQAHATYEQRLEALCRVWFPERFQ